MDKLVRVKCMYNHTTVPRTLNTVKELFFY